MHQLVKDIQENWVFYPTALFTLVSGWAGGGKKFVRAVSQKP